jgi:hypothetical protein
VEGKKDTGGRAGEGKGSIDEIYTPAFRARARSNSVYLFFIRLIGLEGYSILTLGY